MTRLLILSLLLLSQFNNEIYSQVCGTGAIKRWTGTDRNGDQPGPIPFRIDGIANDWRDHITGPLNPSYTENTTPQPDPYLSPKAGANIQNDGLLNKGDKDVPGSDARDLRFFAFTYDQKNIFFYYRRPSNNTTQVYLYYFLDINADGYMKTGEPVVILYYTNGHAQVRMGKYTEADYSRSSILTAKGTPYELYASTIHIEGKGDLMVAPADYVKKDGSTSYNWTKDHADGYGLPGAVIELATQPSPNFSNNEMFVATTTENGFGAEFAIPWSFLKNYNTNSTPLSHTSVFIWHVALQNGSGTNAYSFEDNAGGCCGGAAVSGFANINALNPEVTNHGSPTKYKVIVPYEELAGARTDIQLTQVSVKDIISGSNAQQIDPSKFILTVAPDIDKNGEPDISARTYEYNPTLSVYQPSGPAELITLNQKSKGQFIVEADLIYSSITSITLDFKVTAQIAITNDCEISSDDTKTSSTTIKMMVLPVHFKSFSAVRNTQRKEQVLLKWETATEENNRGFYVQRKVSGQWKNIAFVFSQADNGNSNSELAYEYKEVNTAGGVSQYQIQQVDMDGKTSYSEIRNVGGLNQTSSVQVYPNPGVNGKVSLLFKEVNNPKDVIVNDMNGRVVKQFKAVRDNSLSIDGLQSGFYTIKVMDLLTSITTVEKVVIKK